MNAEYYRAILVLKSPLSIGSGKDHNSDNDLMVDWYNKPIIPGTSIAGAIKSFFSLYYKDLSKYFLGFENQEENDEIYENSESLFRFYDCDIINQEFKISKKRSISIDYKTKIAKDKQLFDFEFLEPTYNNQEIRFNFRFEFCVNHEEYKNAKKLSLLILSALKNGEIRIGQKTSRGYGNFILENIMYQSYNLSDQPDKLKWINFSWENLQPLELCNFPKIKKRKCCDIICDFNIPYSLLIGSYNHFSGVADKSQFSYGDNQIIPGTSWAGLIRNTLLKITDELRVLQGKKWIDTLFGYVRNERNVTISKKSQKSRIKFEDSILKNNFLIDYTRNKISRFSGSTIDGALFTENISVGGTCTLKIKIIDPQNFEIGLILLALFDISNGFEPIGGTVSIGRGILQGSKIKINFIDSESIIKKTNLITSFTELTHKNEYIKVLLEKIEENDSENV